ncbi:MAG: phytanoyl-CoA dioxygenase family protein [Verrucomicrobia bacterium]|nr:phytanoyl-CoA dioxygenase family protein [Verrucomicrobiota bacterium]MDA1085991.1 phytanoyl-CoA dioxygenase family protein [Verrucomicrobiota bacterium]
MSLTPSQLEQYHRDGYIIVPDVFSAEEMDAALVAMDHIFYGKPYAEWLADFDTAASRDVSDGFTTNQAPETGRPQFPTGKDALDRLIENDDYLDMFEQCLGDKASYCNAHLFLRSGPTDKRHSEHPWEGYHIDHGTNSLLPPFGEIGRFDYVNSGAYLHDVEPDGAPMLVIPGSHKVAQAALANGYAGDNVVGFTFKDLREVAGLEEPVPAVAPRGSAMFSSSYLIHAAQPFENKRVRRAFWTLSCCRRDNDRWTRFSNPFMYGEREHMLPFFVRTTPRVRSIFGFPEPGHEYYTQETLALLEKSMPGFDAGPYHAVMGT